MVASQNLNWNSRIFQDILANFPGFIPQKFKDFPGIVSKIPGFSNYSLSFESNISVKFSLKIYNSEAKN